MSEPRFTPGPWLLDPKNWQRVTCPTNLTLAGCNDFDARGTVGTIGYKPNAHLVAAAPDLYEALAAFVAIEFLNEGADEDLAAAYKLGRNVLAKARGEV